MSQAGQGRSVMVQGRIVWTSGDLFKGRVKVDMQTKQPRRNQAGEVMMEYGFGLAVPKTNLQQSGPGQPGEIWAAMHAEAQTMYPNGQIPPSFAMKYKDGDGIDDKGKPFALREGYQGCLVFACTTTLPIKFFRFENGANILINEGIKCGDYVNVQLNIKAHAASGAGKPGLYMNPNAVQFLGYGKEIINTPDGDQIFGTGMPPMPAGASATPVAPAGMLVPTGQPMGNFPAPAAPASPQFMGQPPGMQPPMQGGYAQPAYPSNPAPMAAPAPHYGVVPPAFQPPQGGQPMAAPMPGPVGNGYPQNYPGQPPMGMSGVPGAAATPMGQPMAAPSFATPAGSPAMPPYPGYPPAR